MLRRDIYSSCWSTRYILESGSVVSSHRITDCPFPIRSAPMEVKVSTGVGVAGLTELAP